MQVVTKPYGTIEVDDRQKITCPGGLLGFERLTEYVLLDAKQPPFLWLQSLDVEELAFVLINPFVFKPDYKLDLDDADFEEIGVDRKDEESYLVFAIVTIPENHRLMTANLQGPIIINKATKIAKQCISVSPKWSVRHSILDELAGEKSEAC